MLRTSQSRPAVLEEKGHQLKCHPILGSSALSWQELLRRAQSTEEGSCEHTHYPARAGVNPGAAGNPPTPSKGGSPPPPHPTPDPPTSQVHPIGTHLPEEPQSRPQPRQAELGCMGAMLQPLGSFLPPAHLKGAVAAVQVVQAWGKDELIEGTTQRLQTESQEEKGTGSGSPKSTCHWISIPVPSSLLLRSCRLSFHSAPSPGMSQAEESCRVKPVQCQPAGCVQAERGSCPYSPLAAYPPGIVPAPQSAPVSPPAGGRAGKAGQGCAALPGKKADLRAGQAVDGRGNSLFTLAEPSHTPLMLAQSSLLLTRPVFKPPPHTGQQGHSQGAVRASLPSVQSPLPALPPQGDPDSFTGPAPPSWCRRPGWEQRDG